MIKLNKKEYLDKLHACWIGKNIGGTLGAPFEGTRKFLNVEGFSTPEGEPLPNDDLDLQLVWLTALEAVGAKNLTTNILSEYWLERITPHWNEYGIGKTNLSLGLLPPMSGEFDNEKWKTSNGAWIRSEIWAGIAPAVSDVAVKYAVMDAMVDHGLAEGTYAEIFTASMQSAAYAESNIRKLIEISLEKIPADCMVAKTVRLVMECYDNKIDYKETRERVVEFNKELGWFQAPANLGFVAIGLLYGEGDFKRSMIYAINCGDDTDCTGATVGATLGIIGGTKAIPEDWKNFVGDRIVTVCINGSYHGHTPKTCSQLTERVAALVPDVMKANGVKFEFTDDVSDLPENEIASLNKLSSKDFLTFSPYSYEITQYRAMKIRVELDKTPRVKSGDERKVKLTFTINPVSQQPKKLEIRLIMPDSWTHGDYDRTVALDYRQPLHKIWGISETEFTITAGEKVDAVNRVYAEVTCSAIPYPILVPIIFIG